MNDPMPAQSQTSRPGLPLRIALTLTFAGLLATVATLNRRHVSNEVAPESANRYGKPTLDPKTALARYGFALTEVSRQAGVAVTHHTPQLDPRFAPILNRVADMGASVAVADFDRDGFQDFYVTDSGENRPNHLFRNNHDGTFTDVAAAMGVADLNRAGTGVSTGAIWGDFDNDGYEDLLVYKWGRPNLFHNNAGKGFTDVTETAGLPKSLNCNAAIWLDYDGDGKLDLLLTGYFDEKLDMWRLPNTSVMPDSIEYATNGTRKYLLRGNGDGTFTDVTEKAGLTTRDWTLAAGAADLRGTGYPDIILANDYGVAEYWANDGHGHFHDIGKETGISLAPKSGMNVAFGDILNQGAESLYVSNITEDGQLLQYNNLWVPRGVKGGIPQYENLANDMGVGNGGWSFGAQFGDLNNDGFLDLYLANGYLSGDPTRSYWYDYSKVAGGNKSIISDIANWPPLDGRSLSGYQQKRVWISDGAGRYTDVAQAVGATDTFDGRAVALADFWNRGVLDVVVANERGPLLLYKNTVAPGRHWVSYGLDGAPGRSNRSAIGASVTVYWSGQKQRQDVTGGIGFCAENQRPLHFGLGSATRLEKVVIRWPSRTVQILTAPDDLRIDAAHQIKEPQQ
jgi:hypothetical protein